MSYLVWQLIDSGFPAGGFAHSGGLEASAQHGRVIDAAGVYAFARQTLVQAGRGSLPLVAAAHRDPAALGGLDRLVDVFLSNPVANRASRRQGRALLSSVARCFPDAGLTDFEHGVRTGTLFGHQAPMFGAIFNLLRVEAMETRRAYLFLTTRTVTAAAVRLGLLGAYEAQDLQRELSGEIDRTIDACGAMAPTDISLSAPLIDLCQSTHDRLYSRLFQS